MFQNRLARMAKHWHKWARRQNITCFRLYDKDIPDVPLAIDWYEASLPLSPGEGRGEGYLHIAEYARPHDRAEAEHRAWLEFIVAAAAQVLEVPRERVFVKHRQRQKGLAQYERQADRRHFFEVHEGGHRFWVNLSDYLDTGLFLDHRQTRALVQADAAGKHFLNLFGYTGSFSVYAAAGGAASTTTVDLSNTYLEWARDNLKLNGFVQPLHQLVRADAMSFLGERARSRERAFDLAVVDPPTFSNSKRTDEIWDVQRHHADLLNLLLQQMTPTGKVYFSTNLRRFKLDEEALSPHAEIREITSKTIPPDYRNKRVHRAWIVVRGS
jgi:23S rRNA (cytosine1962-C5)-methyltransferase